MTEILRLEETQDRDGNDEVFVEVSFTSETYGLLRMGHWLTASELAAFKADKSSITTIMDPYLSVAEARKAEELLPREPLE